MDGVTGGYEQVHSVDSETSAQMLQSFKDKISGWDDALDLGAGIGRVTKATLLPHFRNVDLVEPAGTLIDKAKENVPEVRKFYQVGLQDFVFEHQYDCIWLQWVAMYLTDADLLSFLQRAGSGLKTTAKGTGLLFVKENVHEERIVVDREDNSLMRTEKHFEHLFSEAGFLVLSKF